MALRAVKPPDGLQTLAEARIVQPRLAAEEAEREAQVAWREAGEVLRDRPFQGGWVGGRAVDHADLEVEDRAYQKLALACAEGNHGRACGFEGEVVAHAAHPHPVVEAVHRERAGGEPRGLEAARADLGRLRRVGRRLGDVHGLPRGAGGAMQADDELTYGREVVAEGWVRCLGFPQHRLVAEGEGGQVLQPLRHVPASPKPGKEGRL